MWRNHLKTAIRNLLRYKQYSLINVIGLAIGLASAILIYFIIQSEFLFNTHNENLDRIYRINKCYSINNEYKINPSTPYPLSAEVKNRFGEVLESAHCMRTTGLMKHDDQVFKITGED